MKRLLQINECLSGSTGRIVRQIGDIAISEGWESWIAYSAFEPDFACKSKKIRIGSKFDYYRHVVQTRLFDRHGLSSKRATHRLIKEIETIQPDVIHLHNIHGYYLNYEILFDFLKKSEIPLVWTLHDCWPFTGHCAYFSFYGCEKWKTGCNNCIALKDYPKSYCDKSARNWGLKKLAFTSHPNLTIVTVSEWLKEIVEQSFLSDYNIEVIHNGIDLEVFKPINRSDYIRNKYKIGIRKIILGVASVWDRRKGLKDFIRLSEFLNHEDYCIVIVGKTPAEDKRLLEKSSVIVIDQTDDVIELACLYSEAHVFVNTSYEDNYPTVNLEAIACGTPVITYKTGGSPEAVDENIGIVVPQGNIDALSKAILSVKKSEYRQFCLDWSKVNFSGDICFKRYINLYKNLVGGSNCC